MVTKSDAEYGAGETQFGRALRELDIAILCANTSQAKGRVERAHLTLQDRLVKELRLRGICDKETANACLPTFRDDYNRRFAKQPRSSDDAHRALLPSDDLDAIFTWQVERKVTKNLVVQYKRVRYLLPPEMVSLCGKRVLVREREDGRVTIHYQGNEIAYRAFEKDRFVDQGQVVENKRLGTALRLIRTQQQDHGEKLLAKHHISKREKARLREKFA